MAYQRLNDGPRHVTYQTDQIAATGTNSSDGVPVASFTAGSYQVVWAGVTNTVEFDIESTIDGTNWNPVAGGKGLITEGASGSLSDGFTSPIPGAEVRLTITSADTGTLDFYMILKEG